MTETGFLFIYHDNGNLLTKSGNGENWQLEYNALNQLTRANISTPQGASVSEYAYDHDGIRVGKTINGTEMIQYVVDKNRPYAQVLEEERTNGLLSATTSYVYGDALISAATEGSTHYYHADGLGSVRGLSDASGALTDSYIYDAYGLLTTSSGATVNPYLYRGEQYDPELDAYYLRARYYQPGTGRFLTTDPVEGFPNAPISLHRYVYGNDTPVSMIDPSGQSSISDMLFAFTVINIGLSVSANQFQAIGNVYSTLGKYAFPDGPVLGITTDMPWYIWDLFNLITTTCNLPEALQHPTYPGFPGFNHIFGYEVLFSISSAQIGLFRVYGLGNGIGRDAKRTTMPLPDIGGSIYEGEVYNLWNAQNYAGPFYSINFSGITVAFSPMDVFINTSDIFCLYFGHFLSIPCISLKTEKHRNQLSKYRQ